MIELVIDGTNFGGKTPLVTRLVEHLAGLGLVATTASPFREVEVYGLWDDAPEQAAGLIVERMAAQRASHRGDVLVWDRGWPTCFVATAHPGARRRFLPLPRLTFLLLNTAQATARKVAKYGLSPEVYPWMHGRKLKDEISYDELARRFADDLRVFRPTLEGDRFDLDLLAREIGAEVEAERRGAQGLAP
ncbi:MAG: hypothetical protein MUF64_18800 [Polyangiaceae bacterium]|jgi:hypothetical protein|nr:hypothetical protein [Polyangiaceae bacterium]